MALTPEQRKVKLGHGGLSRIARRTRRTPSHVSQVNRGLRPDERVVRAITQLIVEKNPDIKPDDVWPMAG